MRMLVIGSSASAGHGNDDVTQAWPWLAAARLEEAIGESVEVKRVAIYHTGPKAVGAATKAVEANKPDLVVFNYGSVICAVRTVANRVRNRFGARAYSYFRRAESRFESGPAGQLKQASRANHWARWLARHIIGTEANASFEEASGIQVKIIHGLARFEDTVVVVFSDPNLPRSVVRENKGADEIFTRLRARNEDAARQHRFLVANANPLYNAHPDRDSLYQPDLIHRTVEGHAIQAQVLLETLLNPPSPYAASAGA